MKKFVEIILPLALGQTYTYEVPEKFVEQVSPGMRVEVQFGRRKIYAGIIARINTEEPSIKTKPVLSILDEQPIVSVQQFQLWNWMADYYMCTLGEVMLAALPGYLKLASETIIVKNDSVSPSSVLHDDEEYLILEALEFQTELTLSQIKQILDKKTVFPLINKMIKKDLIKVREELNSSYSPKIINIIKWHGDYAEKPGEAVALVEKYEKQVDCLLTLIQLSKVHDVVTKASLKKKSNVSYSTIKSLVKKKVLVEEEKEISRVGDLHLENKTNELPQLSDIQIKAKESIIKAFESKETVLLHGVTGSGKTRIYIDLIQQALDNNKQVLYLLPEIALTNHFIKRLQNSFGPAVTTYHSRMNPNERAEVYKKAGREIRILVGPRSSIFLPFKDLGLIIIDESHDYSYKQQDPAPRYNGRDAAIVLAKLHTANVILGTATPSLESWYNVQQKKYSYVPISKRVGDLKLPTVNIYAINKIPSVEIVDSVSKKLLKHIEKNIQEGKQCLIFRNRRGYAPVLKCDVCGWHAECPHCDVSLTYHKATKGLRCHSCGYRTEISKSCPDCGNTKLLLKGSGTEKIEETLRLMLPDARIDRLDADTASGKSNMSKILHLFESGQTDILIGTQMITKGLNFENVGLVGVILADALMYFPDFRSEERAHQILFQVSGRAGRSYEDSEVFVQTYQPEHSLFKSLSWEGQSIFFERILKERRQFGYPPFVRFVKLSFVHKDYDTSRRSAEYFVQSFTKSLNNEVLGPVDNPVKRIRSRYIVNCTIKVPKSDEHRKKISSQIKQVTDELFGMNWSKGIRIVIDVDPY